MIQFHSFNPQDDSDREPSDRAYRVNCRKCNGVLEVFSPRLDARPIKVWPTDFGLCLSESIEIVRTHCPHCGGETWTKFQYP